MNIQDALQFAELEIQTQEASTDGRYLLSHIVNKDFTWLKTWPDKILTEIEEKKFKALINRRIKGEPIAYITGEKHFWSLRLETNDSTLIPRPETELLVEQALLFLSDYQTKLNGQIVASRQTENKDSLNGLSILDLGTGTGAIGLSIGKERPNDRVIASDYKKNAVALAQRNARANQINNIEILQSNWFSALGERLFDLIVSNPPYVQENDPHLLEGDLRYEPNSALISSGDGLDDIRKIVLESKKHLRENGGLMIEHGFQQGMSVNAIFEENGFSKIRPVNDLSGLERITMGVYRLPN